MKRLAPALVLVALIVVGVLIYISIHRSDMATIQEWARDHGTEAVVVESRIFSIGPFWIRQKHQRVYRVQLKDGRIAWLRTGVFGGEWIVE